MIYKGLYRLRGEHGAQDLVRVTDGDMTFDIDEASYHFGAHQPPLETLQWNDEMIKSSK